MYKYLIEVEKGKPASRRLVRYTGASSLKTDSATDCWMDSCWDVFRMSEEKNPGNRMLGRRETVNGRYIYDFNGNTGEYVWLTCKQAYDILVKVGNSMRTIGLAEGDKCGTFGANCPEWIMSMEGSFANTCNAHGLCCVPYGTLGAGAVEFIICHAEVSLAFVEERKKPELFKTLPNASKYLKTLVCFGNVTPEQKEAAEKQGSVLYSWNEFLQLTWEGR